MSTDATHTQQEDLVVVVNEQDEVVGTAPRSVAHTSGIPHRISVVYVLDKEGRMLVQKRRDGRRDHSAAGHVDPCETYHDTACRELSEELGITGVVLTSIAKGSSLETDPTAGTVIRHLFEVFVTHAEPQQLQVAEVEGVYWEWPLEVLRDMEAEHGGTPYAEGFRASLPLYLAYTATAQTGDHHC